MLKAVRLKNLKAFEAEEFPMSPLTMLMGQNGAGKSALIQALLLVKQSLSQGRITSDGLRLNGDLCAIGVGRDLLRQGANEDVIGICLIDDEIARLDLEFQYMQDADKLPMISDIAGSPSYWQSGFTYISADRAGPRLTSPRSITKASERQIGINGEGALAVLEFYRAEILHADDPRRDGQSGSLEELFQSQLARISPNARLDIKPYGDVDRIAASFDFTGPGGVPGRPMRPTNVGFGLSYSLPIIVACLTAPKGSLLIVENPEAHLHTYGQRAISELLLATAAAGVQVIVETHSREIFYWLRRKAVLAEIDERLGCINYLEIVYDEGERTSVCTKLSTLNSDLAAMSQNFFDAFGSPTDHIMPRR